MSTDQKPKGDHELALLCAIHTSSLNAQKKVLDLLASGRSYYAQPDAQCTTWSYFLPSTREKAPSQLVPRAQHDTVIYGMEIYSDKQALSTQQEKSWFKDFQKSVKDEGLYADRGEAMTVWYPTAGFVARKDVAAPYGGVVMLAVFTCKEGKRDAVVETIRNYTEYVSSSEPDVLTYCTLTRPKAPNQVLLFERYKDLKALGAHGTTKEFKAMFKGIAPNIEVKQTKLQEFKELDNSFVTNFVGGGGQDTGTLSSKL